MREVEPGRVVVAGDLHGRAAPAEKVIARAAELLDGEPEKLILQAGDFGVWPGWPGEEYLRRIVKACRAHGVSIWFVEGNHDWPGGLPELRIGQGQPGRTVSWLSRGHRWSWHGRTWLAMGGAVSVDKAGPPCGRCGGQPVRRGPPCGPCGGTGRIPRVEGVNWWPEEEIAPAQAADAIADGPADVLLSHDCPAGVVHSFADRPWWFAPADLARAEEHARLLQGVATATLVGHVIHGHLHMGYQRHADFGYGPVVVTGLDMQEKRYNYGTLDVRDMSWDMTP